MENLLFINACVRGERSRTLKLARRFLDAYRACVLLTGRRRSGWSLALIPS